MAAQKKIVISPSGMDGRVFRTRREVVTLGVAMAAVGGLAVRTSDALGSNDLKAPSENAGRPSGVEPGPASFLTPYDFGGRDPSAGTDNTDALRRLFEASANGDSREIYIPAGVWESTGSSAASLPLTSNLTVRGAGRQSSEIRISETDRPMFAWDGTVSGVLFENLTLNGAAEADIFAPGTNGGIHASTFRSCFFNQQVGSHSIWNQDNDAPFIHITFEQVEFQRAPDGKAIPFFVRTGSGNANSNLFSHIRVNGLNVVSTPFFHFESTLPDTYLTDWTFINVVGEQNPGGLIHSFSACGWSLIAVTDQDARVPYSADLLRFAANRLDLYPRDITLIGSTHRGSSLNAGVSDISVDAQGSTGQGITVIGCNPTPTSQIAQLTLPANAEILSTRGYATAARASSMTGTGSPEGVVDAPVGTIYTRIDGAAGSTLYVKESGSQATGWAAK